MKEMTTRNWQVFLFGILYYLFIIPEVVSVPVARPTLDFNGNLLSNFGPTEDVSQLTLKQNKTDLFMNADNSTLNAERNSGSVLTTMSGKHEREVTLKIPEVARPTLDFNGNVLSIIGPTEDVSQLGLKQNKTDRFWNADRSTLSHFGPSKDVSQLALKLNTKNLFLYGARSTLSAKRLQTTMSSKQKTKVTLDIALGYNPWVVTFGNQLMDAELTKGSVTNEGSNVASNTVQNFGPNLKMSTVCTGSTIPYGQHKVMKWLERHVHKHVHTSRAFYMELRHDLFLQANSEMCHDKKYAKWMEYQECSLRRNQRLESYIPQYPLHQIIKA